VGERRRAFAETARTATRRLGKLSRGPTGYGRLIRTERPSRMECGAGSRWAAGHGTTTCYADMVARLPEGPHRSGKTSTTYYTAREVSGELLDYVRRRVAVFISHPSLGRQSSAMCRPTVRSAAVGRRGVGTRPGRAAVSLDGTHLSQGKRDRNVNPSPAIWLMVCTAGTHWSALRGVLWRPVSHLRLVDDGWPISAAGSKRSGTRCVATADRLVRRSR